MRRSRHTGEITSGFAERYLWMNIPCKKKVKINEKNKLMD